MGRAAGHRSPSDATAADLLSGPEYCVVEETRRGREGEMERGHAQCMQSCYWVEGTTSNVM